MSDKIQIEETRDWKAVWEIYQQPEIVDRVTDDKWERLTDAARRGHVERVVTDPKNHTFLVRVDGKVVGCFLTVREPGDVNKHMVHTMLLRECRGADAIAAGRMAIGVAFALPDVEQLESWCPSNNPEAYLFARMCGFRHTGVAPVEWVKGMQRFAIQVVSLAKEHFLNTR